MNNKTQEILLIMKRRSENEPTWQTLWQSKALIEFNDEQKTIKTIKQSSFSMELNIKDQSIETNSMGETNTKCTFTLHQRTPLEMSHALGIQTFHVITTNMQIFDHKILIDYELHLDEKIDTVTIVWEIKESTHESSRS